MTIGLLVSLALHFRGHSATYDITPCRALRSIEEYEERTVANGDMNVAVRFTFTFTPLNCIEFRHVMPILIQRA